MRIVVLALALMGCAANANLAALALVDRTRTTTATYAVYLWGAAVGEDGKVEEHWSAEFHSGDWHRLEGPTSRIVANCNTHQGFFHNVATGQTTVAPNAYRGACGIFDAPGVTSTELFPTIQLNGETLDQVLIKDAKFSRYYAIDSRGAIRASDWVAANGASVPCITTRAVGYETKLPASDIFSEASLSVPVTPAAYQAARAQIPAVPLSGKQCGPRS